MKRSRANITVRMICFRRWSNKSYSVFASLKALIKISVISVSYSILVYPFTVIAQPDSIATTSKNIEIDEVVISSPQTAATYSELLRAVSVITHQEIAQMPLANVNELLRSLTSVDIRQRGGQGVQADISFRGGTFDQVLILLNGVNITDPQSGHHNLNIPIDLASIERIELLQGPGARVYGPGAFSGAINIITTPRKNELAKFMANVGQNGLIRTSASSTLTMKRSSVFITASSAKSDGYIENTDFNIHNLFAHSKTEIKNGDVNIQAGYQDKSFGAQSFYSPRFPEQFEQTGTFFSSVSLSKKIRSITIAPSVYFRQHTDRFELFRHQSPDWYSGHNYHKSRVSGAKISASSISVAGRTRAGLEYRDEVIYSNVLGTPMPTPKPIRGFSDTSYTHSAYRSSYNLFTDHTVYLERFIISGGGLITYCNEYGYNWNYGVDASLRLTKSTNLYISLGNTLRYPTFTDLYYNGPTNQGNVNLRPEHARNYEIGFRTSSYNFSLNLSLFHRVANDVIDWVKAPEEDKWRAKNHTQISTYGFEIFNHIKHLNALPFIYDFFVGYSFVHSDKQSNLLQSYYVLDYLKHKLSTSISHSLYRKIGVSWSIIWQSREGTYTDFPSGIDMRYKSFALVNLRLYADFKNLNIYFDIQNLGNTTYIDLGNIPQPKRWASVGISYSIRE